MKIDNIIILGHVFFLFCKERLILVPIIALRGVETSQWAVYPFFCLILPPGGRARYTKKSSIMVNQLMQSEQNFFFKYTVIQICDDCIFCTILWTDIFVIVLCCLGILQWINSITIHFSGESLLKRQVFWITSVIMGDIKLLFQGTTLLTFTPMGNLEYWSYCACFGMKKESSEAEEHPRT